MEELLFKHKMKITGTMIYYYNVCERKLWYHINGINLEDSNVDVQIGKEIDDMTYKRKLKHVSIEETINIDFLETEGVIYEVKKSKSIEEASIWQIKYYIYFLNSRGIMDITGKLVYPLLRKALDVELEDKDIDIIKSMIVNINIIAKENYPRKLIRKSICKKCAFFDLCWI